MIILIAALARWFKRRRQAKSQPAGANAR